MKECQSQEGFSYKLWTNSDVEKILDQQKYKDIYNKIPAHDWAVKKDFLSYLILNKYGGLYTDLSIWCKRPPLRLHENYSNYFVYVPLLEKDPNVQFPNNHVALTTVWIVASKKDSALIKDIIQRFGHFVDYNKKYTLFSDKLNYYGWLGQVVVVEAVSEYCSINKDCFNDIYFLKNSDFRNINNGMPSSSPYFIDSDQVPIAFYVKSFELGNGISTFNSLLGY